MEIIIFVTLVIFYFINVVLLRREQMETMGPSSECPTQLLTTSDSIFYFSKPHVSKSKTCFEILVKKSFRCRATLKPRKLNFKMCQTKLLLPGDGSGMVIFFFFLEFDTFF